MYGTQGDQAKVSAARLRVTTSILGGLAFATKQVVRGHRRSCAADVRSGFNRITALPPLPHPDAFTLHAAGFMAIQLFVSLDLQHFNMFEWLTFVASSSAHARGSSPHRLNPFPSTHVGASGIMLQS